MKLKLNVKNVARAEAMVGVVSLRQHLLGAARSTQGTVAVRLRTVPLNTGLELRARIRDNAFVYTLPCCSGILGNHPLYNERFVTTL